MRYDHHVSITCRMAIIYFLEVYFPKFLSHNFILVNAKGFLSCIKTTPKPFLEASHSNSKFLVELGANNIGVVHMACFKDGNACYVASLHAKALSFSMVVKGDALLPFFFTKLL